MRLRSNFVSTYSSNCFPVPLCGSGSGFFATQSRSFVRGTYRPREPGGSLLARAAAEDIFATGRILEIVPAAGRAQAAGSLATRYSRQISGRSGWIEQDSSSRNGQAIPS